MTGCTKLFLNLMLSPPPLDSELVTGKRILRIAKEVGVDHVVYTSSVYTTHMAELKSMQEGSIVWWTTNAKRLLEEEVKKAGVFEQRWTILRPGFFMQNFVGASAGFMYADFLKRGVWVTGIPAETPIPLIDTEDIGRFAAKAFLEPDRFPREVDLAGEYRTPGEVVEALRRASGKEMRVEVLEGTRLEEAGKKDVFVDAQKVIGDLGRVVDLEVVRGYGVPMSTFEDFLVREKEALDATYGQLPARK
ncbi:hypothetical protein GE09DRAFT_1163441 [Coniochaeta sp. 2T2.1]|nr:hypothetical protein GE09DRAFT_1163441 [Coniochaeta sp. 2T2.1]